jgi:hypothetical protein
MSPHSDVTVCQVKNAAFSRAPMAGRRGGARFFETPGLAASTSRSIRGIQTSCLPLSGRRIASSTRCRAAVLAAASSSPLTAASTGARSPAILASLAVSLARSGSAFRRPIRIVSTRSSRTRTAGCSVPMMRAAPGNSSTRDAICDSGLSTTRTSRLIHKTRTPSTCSTSACSNQRMAARPWSASPVATHTTCGSIRTTRSTSCMPATAAGRSLITPRLRSARGARGIIRPGSSTTPPRPRTSRITRAAGQQHDLCAE